MIYLESKVVPVYELKYRTNRKGTKLMENTIKDFKEADQVLLKNMFESNELMDVDSEFDGNLIDQLNNEQEDEDDRGFIDKVHEKMSNQLNERFNRFTDKVNKKRSQNNHRFVKKRKL